MRNTTASSDVLRCSPVTANRGRLASLACRLTMRPSSATTVSSSKATTPVARLAYHIQVDEFAGIMQITMRCQAEHGLGATYEEDLIRCQAGTCQEPRRYREDTAEAQLSTASAIPRLHQWCASGGRRVVAREPNP